MNKRVRIGDVVEIPTKRGLAYALYALRHEQMGGLLHILPGFFPKIPADFSELVKQPPRFAVFFPIGAAVHRGIFKIVTNVPIPDSLKKLPTFKQKGHIDRQGRVHDWLLRDGERSRRIGKRLRPEHRSLPEFEIINDTLLIERLEEDWTPELEVQRVEARGAGESPPWARMLGGLRRVFGRAV